MLPVPAHALATTTVHPKASILQTKKQQATCLTHEGLFFPPGMVALRQLSLILEFGFSMLFRVEVLAIIQVFG